MYLLDADSVQQLHVQEPSTYAKPKAASAVLGSWWCGVLPETCCVLHKYELKFWYTVASCWIFFVNYTTMHRSTNIKSAWITHLFHYKQQDTMSHTSTESSWNMPGGPSGCKQPCPHHTIKRPFSRRQTGGPSCSGRSQGTLVHFSVQEEQGWNEEGRMCAPSGPPAEVRSRGRGRTHNGHVAAMCFRGKSPQCDDGVIISLHF